MNVGIVLAGGLGKRFQSKIPKQFMSLNGKMVIQYSIDAMKESGVLDYIIVVTSRGWFDYLKKLRNIDKIVGGGKQRTDSVYNGLLACPKNTKYVLFHDAGRPFIKKEHIQTCIKALKKGIPFVGTVELITDALIENSKYNNIIGELDRNKHKLYQTPEAFNYKVIMKYYENLTKNYTSIATPLIESGILGKIIISPDINTKLTYTRDLFRAEQLIKYQEVIKRIPDVKGLRILLFGGSGGIGQEIKKQLKELGAFVCAPSSKDFNLGDFPKAHTLYYKTFNCIIHSAGAYTKDDEGLIANYDKIMNVNFKSIVHIAELAPRWLLRGGNIVLIGSTASSKGRSGLSLYSASKSALNTFIEAYSEKLIERNIKINVICPAKVSTRLQKIINPNANLKKMIQPKEIAKIIIGYCDVDFTGHIVYVKVGI